MKPILKRGLTLGQSGWGWICQTPLEQAQGWDRYNERLSTWSETPAEAWRRWFERTRENASGMIPTGSTFNILGGSRLHQKCQGLIDHDRYLLKVDSRQPGGKGNM